MPEPSIAYLSQRKLHLRTGDQTRVIESEFARTVRERAASIERRHAWKTEGRGAQFMGMWAAQGAGAQGVPVLITGVTAQSSGDLYYSLETDAVSGIFHVATDGIETRLFHTADLRVRHAAIHPDQSIIAASAFSKDNTRSNIVTLPVPGTEFQEVTEGDSFDQAPQWVPGNRRRIVFQSAGVGRDAAGRFAALGPCAIQELDLDSGNLEEIAADPSHDFLQPRKTSDDVLYCIRKPYETGRPQANFLDALKDAALFPFRMGGAIMQYFNVFSMMYTGKPLLTSKGSAQKHMDPRQMFIYGNLAQAAMTLNAEEESKGLVPSSWELVRMEHGRFDVIARSVLAFDVTADHTVVFSDGGSITRINGQGRSERLVRGEMIERVLAI